MPIKITHRGNFKNIDKMFKNASSINRKYLHIFQKYGKEGVRLLKANTPKDTGETADSWYYEITRTTKGINLGWYNSNTEDGVPIVILLQYGHATKSGSFVKGRDFINPSLRPIFNKLSEDLWREVTE